MNPTLLNATPVAVTYRDGRSETITLGELSLRNLYIFIKHLGGSDTPALVALCAGKPSEWVDTLTDESFDALVAESIRLNFQRAADRAKNDPVALGRMGGMLLELESLVTRMGAQLSTLNPQLAEAKPTPGLSGTASSPAPAPSGSAVATGSA